MSIQGDCDSRDIAAISVHCYVPHVLASWVLVLLVFVVFVVLLLLS